MKKLLLFLVGAVQILPLQAEQFEQIWEKTQKIYEETIATVEKSCPDRENYFHPFWLETAQKIQNLIQGKPNQKFLEQQFISITMVRRGFSEMQNYETIHLQYCLSPRMRELLKQFKEPDLQLLPHESKEFNCTTTSLGHLFYATKALEQIEQNPKLIIELGGGYGNLARIFKILLPETTIVILDLPEVIALQAIFLKATTPQTKVIVHSSGLQPLQKGAIHLVPVFFLDEIEETPDLFVSTFALSESPLFVQEKVAAKNFFDATVCYLVGQINGWDNMFERHTTVLDAVRACYKHVYCHPFHSHLAKQTSYELIAYNKK